MNETSLTSGSIVGSGAFGAEICVNNELAEIEGFLEGDRGEFGKKVLG